MVPTIRPATAADLPAILDIYNDAILTTTAVYDYEPHTLAMRQQWFEAKQGDRLPVLVAIAPEGGSPTIAPATDQVIGFGALGWFRAWAAYCHTLENSIYVAASHRGQGVGKALLEALIAAARQRRCHTLVAGIDSENTASHRLHEAFGFQPVGYFTRVGYKFDRWLDLKFYQLLLEPESATPPG